MAPPRSLPASLRLVILDLDGVVCRWPDLIPGAVALVEGLRASGILVRFATNNSTLGRPAVVDQLGKMGIATTIEEVATSASATVGYLRAHMPAVRRVLSIGSPDMTDELAAAGFLTTPAADVVAPEYGGEPLAARYDAVVVGMDLSFGYGHLAVAASAIRAGARFVATGADGSYPTAAGFLPAAGSIVAAIAAASGVEPLIIGKPQPGMFTSILAASGLPAHQALVIGDNPDSDIVAARRAGIYSALVLTGVAHQSLVPLLAGERRPDLVLADLGELAEVLDLPGRSVRQGG